MGGETSSAVIRDWRATSAGDGACTTSAVLTPERGRYTGGPPSPPPDGAAPFPTARVGTAAGLGATPPAGTRGARATANAGMGSSTAPATAAHVADVMRFSTCGFAGVRREVTTQRKELEIRNSHVRAGTKKVDDIAVLANRFTASLIIQRRTLDTMAAHMSTVLTNLAANCHALTPSVARATADAAAVAVESGVPTAVPGEMDARDAQCVLDLKVCGTSSVGYVPPSIGRNISRHSSLRSVGLSVRVVGLWTAL